MKRKELAKKTILLTLIISLFLITACDGFGRRDACTGPHCKYYTGTQGVVGQQLSSPPTLYYRSGDLYHGEGNMIEFTVRLENRGPSDAMGAVFLSGFSPTTFDIWRDGRRIDVSNMLQGCYFDVFGIGELTDISTWNLMFDCFGTQFTRYGDRTSANLNFQNIANFLPEDWPLTQRMEDGFLRDIDVTFRDGEGLTQFSIGTNIGSLNFGQSLMLLVSALDFESFGGASFYLEGHNHQNPVTSTDFKDFKVQMVKPWPPGQDFYYQDYTLKLCYAYTTFVSPKICIDPDPFAPERKECTDYSVRVDSSQGAPVAVTNVRTENTGGEVYIEMTIKNVGRGDVWDVGYLEYCSPYYPDSVRHQMKDIIYVGYATLEGQVLDCGNTFRLRLDPQTREAKLRCRYNLERTGYVRGGYESPLQLELWYGYEEIIPTHNIGIRRLE